MSPRVMICDHCGKSIADEANKAFILRRLLPQRLFLGEPDEWFFCGSKCMGLWALKHP